MSSHTVALDAEAYAALKAHKRASESFSDVVKRLVRPWEPISSAAGLWKDMSPKERREIDGYYRLTAEANRRRDERVRRMCR